MSKDSSIKYLTQKQIDREKWDASIASSPNGLIYAYSFYLDHMAKHWDALVLNDYEAVMPLTWNKKYGFHYLYQPFLCASLGIFGTDINAATTNSFLSNIPSKFRYIDISLNHGNLASQGIAGLYQRKNYILNLSDSYGELFNSFNDNVKRNIKKALQNGCVVNTPSFTEILALAKTQLRKAITVSDDEFNRFSNLYEYLAQKGVTKTYGVTSADGQLLSSCVFFFWQNRVYYILVGNHTTSKGTGASHAMLNAFIKDHAASGIILDFEGSDVPGPALFYSSFGAAEEIYPAVKINRLPGPLIWLKK